MSRASRPTLILGLTLVREIVTQHGFEATLRNRPEGGASFRLVL
ncbi:MAG: hypothetical protein ACRD2J_08315 [Thermoanaerobaculia bacterium]